MWRPPAYCRAAPLPSGATASEIRAVLQEANFPVEPGQSVAGEVRLHNDGDGEVELSLAVIGPARPYSWLAPTTVILAAGTEAGVRIGFHLPRASVPRAGPLPFEVVVRARGQQAPAATAAGTVEVRPFSVLSCTLSPPADGGGRRSARRELTVGNRGNAPASTVLRAEVEGDRVDVRVEPGRVVVAPGDKAVATVEVAPKRPILIGKARTWPFRLLAEPEVGDAVEASGELVQKPVLGAAGVLTLVAVVALVAGALVAISQREPDVPLKDAAAAGGAKLDACPAKGHTDAYGVRGLSPEEIDKLPNAYTFLRIRQDGCTPVRFNPCEPVHYVQNAAAAPPEVIADVHEAFRRLSRATGIEFVDDGFTDETTRAGPYVPQRYGSRWAPILIVWEHFPPAQTSGPAQVLGQTVPYREQDVVVSGRLRFNVDAYNDEATRTPIRYGFGPPPGSGTGPIGRNQISWGRIVLHELAHVAGLGHTRDRGSLMYPDAAQQTVRPTDFAQPDLLGLRYLGREMGCLPSPPLPTG